MKVYFVRHAEPDYNSIAYGPGAFPGPELTDFGWKQAYALTDILSKISFDKIFCSDYIRTKQTIEPSKERLGIEVIYDSRIREVADVHNGYMEKNNFPESHSSQIRRLESFIDDLKKLDGSSILIVAHFNTIEYVSRKLSHHIKKPKFAELHCVNYKVSKL